MSIEMLSKYNFVVARFDRDPTITFQEFFYEESPSSVPLTLNEKTGIALGLNSPHSVTRCTALGWTDVTESIQEISAAKKEAERSKEKVDQVVAKAAKAKAARSSRKKK